MSKGFYFQVKEYLLLNEIQFSENLQHPSEIVVKSHYKCDCGNCSICRRDAIKDDGIFLFSNQIGFRDESFVLMWKTEFSNLFEYSIRHRDTRQITELNKTEFFMYLGVLCEMDRLRRERIRLRKLILNKEVTSYHRDKLINEII